MYNYCGLPPVLVLSLLAVVSPSQGQSQTTMGEFKKSLICLCECNMTVEACQGSMACESAEKLTREARAWLNTGVDKQQILAGFVAQYGEHILAAPPKKGFNLTAWILPFAAILIAGIGIIATLRRWVGSTGGKSSGPFNNRVRAEDSVYQEELEELLRSMD